MKARFFPWHLRRHIPLTPKMLIVTILVGALVGVVFDSIQTKKIETILLDQTIQRLARQANENRVRFDHYLDSYYPSVKLIVSQKRFIDYVSEKFSAEAGQEPLVHFIDIPFWMPEASVLRHFGLIHYAFLVDAQDGIREIFQDYPEPPPSALRSPSSYLSRLSHSQSLTTSIDGHPFVIAAESLHDEAGGTIATLMLASKIDDDFLITSLGSGSEDNMVGFLDEDGGVLATNGPEFLTATAGSSVWQNRYLITGKSFFDRGASDLTLQFVSFISKAEFEELNRSVLSQERFFRLLTSSALIFSFTLIMFWVTARIKKMTCEITAYSRNSLGGEPPVSTSGDQLFVLESQFHYFIEEIVVARERLKVRAEELLHEKTIYLDSIMRSSPVAIAATDLDLRIKYYNHTAEQLFHYRSADVIGRTVPEIHLREKVAAERLEQVLEIVRRDNLYEYHVETKRGDGSRLCLDSRVSCIMDRDKKIVGYVLMSIDATKRIEAEEAVASQAKFPEENPYPVLRIAQDGTIIYANSMARPLLAFWQCAESMSLPEPQREMLRAVFSSQEKHTLEVAFDARVYLLSFAPIIDEGYVNVYGNDITKLVEATKKLEHLSVTDPLTQVVNRMGFNRAIQAEVNRSKRYADQLSLIMFDLDHFKRINDTFGHLIGDEVLITVVSLVKKTIRDIDILARWGGEEFMVLTPRTSLDDAGLLAERLRENIAAHPFPQVGQITVSLGVTSLCGENDGVDSILQRADDLLYRAKEKGRNRVEIAVG